MPLNRLTLRVYLLGVTQMVLTLLISIALYRALGPPRDAPFRGPAHLARFFVSSVMVHPEDPARMRQDAERLRQLLGVRMSIYGGDGALVLSSHAPPLPPLAAIRAFEAAARLGSFTRAAEELAMSQAAVSYQIKLLEARLATPLFVRLPRQVVLTEAGQRLASAATDAFDGLRGAIADIRAIDREYPVAL